MPAPHIDRAGHAAEWGQQLIANVELREWDVPSADADISALTEFALTFDGYAAVGEEETFAMHQAVLDRLHRDMPPGSDLTELRTALFCCQRGWHWEGQPPYEGELDDARAIVAACRDVARRHSRPGWFKAAESKRQADLAHERWGTCGPVLPPDLVLENLDVAVRASAVTQFQHRGIKWWRGRRDVPRVAGPTGYLNSSQVACVNHLEPARLDRELASAILHAVDPGIVDAVEIEDEGFVAYEWIGLDDHLREGRERQRRVRGANVTSLDALMVGVRADRERVVVGIEWKYQESYPGTLKVVSSHGTDRAATYAPHLSHPDSPIVSCRADEVHWDPFDQLMRQTLFLWRMCQANELGVVDWRHVWVVPRGNTALLRHGQREGRTTWLDDGWRRMLHEPERFSVMSPSALMQSIPDGPQGRQWRWRLAERYLT